jgi:hypothetical protein
MEGLATGSGAGVTSSGVETTASSATGRYASGGRAMSASPQKRMPSLRRQLFANAAIQRLYESDDFPLQRRLSE